jgi:hypothetical protein
MAVDAAAAPRPRANFWYDGRRAAAGIGSDAGPGCMRPIDQPLNPVAGVAAGSVTTSAGFQPFLRCSTDDVGADAAAHVPVAH